MSPATSALTVLHPLYLSEAACMHTPALLSFPYAKQQEVSLMLFKRSHCFVAKLVSGIAVGDG